MPGEKEVELTWIVEIGDFSGLAKAQSFEHHLQFEYKLPDKEDGGRRGKVRVRRTTKQDQVTYEEMIKVPRDETSSLGDDEYPIEITESYFAAWVKTFGNTGVSKTRYTFVAKAKKFGFPVMVEVDVFSSPDGKRFKYAKVDIEVHQLMERAKQSDISSLDIKVDFASLPLEIGRIIQLGGKDNKFKEEITTFFKTVSCITQV